MPNPGGHKRKVEILQWTREGKIFQTEKQAKIGLMCLGDG